MRIVNGHPAISYYDQNSQTLLYIRATDPIGNNWSIPVPVDHDNRDDGKYSSLAIVNGHPAIAYYNDTNNDLRYARAIEPSGTTWTSPASILADGGFGVNVGKYCSLEDVNGSPAISYYDEAGHLRYVRAITPTGNAWGTPVNVTDIDEPHTDAEHNAGLYTSLELVNGHPAISYQDRSGGTGRLLYVRAADPSGTNWNPPVLVDTDPGFYAGLHTSLAIVNGGPAISYVRIDVNGIGKLAYAQASDGIGSGWNPPITLDHDDIRESTLLVVDGFPAVSYYNGTTDNINYIRATDVNGNAWSAPIIVDGDTDDDGRYNSMVIAQGKPAISYFDATNNTLNYIRSSNATGEACDSDGDNVCDDIDNCVDDYNPGQEDHDFDGVGDICDNCPDSLNPIQSDADSDGFGDACDTCPGSNDSLDADSDGVPDSCDTCPGSDDSADVDGDSVPDGCDICPSFNDSIDSDSDGVPDGCDTCPGSDNSADVDGDSVPDGCDICPGFNDNIDADNDGVPDGCDTCPGSDDSADVDGDSVPDGCDNCPFEYNPDQEDSDNNGLGDLCDETSKCLDPNDLIMKISEYDIKGGNGLINKVRIAIEKCERGNVNDAIKNYKKIKEQIEKKRGKQISDDIANELISCTNDIINLINEGTLDCSSSNSGLRTFEIPDNVIHNIFENSQEFNEKIKLQVFPNPFYEEMSISIVSQQVDTLTAALYSISGNKMIQSQKLSIPSKGRYEFKISGLNLPSGLYILQIITSNGDMIIKRVIRSSPKSPRN